MYPGLANVIKSKDNKKKKKKQSKLEKKERKNNPAGSRVEEGSEKTLSATDAGPAPEESSKVEVTPTQSQGLEEGINQGNTDSKSMLSASPGGPGDDRQNEKDIAALKQLKVIPLSFFLSFSPSSLSSLSFSLSNNQIKTTCQTRSLIARILGSNVLT